MTVLVSFLAALLTGLGIGSGGLYLLWLTLVEGAEQRAAQGVNLLFSIAALAASALTNALHGRIPRKSFLICLLCGVPFAVGGGLLAGVLPAGLLRRLLGLLLIAGGVLVLTDLLRKKKEKKRMNTRVFPQST